MYISVPSNTITTSDTVVRWTPANNATAPKTPKWRWAGAREALAVLELRRSSRASLDTRAQQINGANNPPGKAVPKTSNNVANAKHPQ